MIRDTSSQDVIIERPRNALRNRVLTGVGVVSALLFAVVAYPAYQQWSSAEQTVSRERLRFATVTRGELSRDVAAQGVVVAAIKPTLFSPVVGTVNLAVTAGESVTRGQTLAQVDSPETISLLDQESAALTSAETSYQRQQIEARKTELKNQQMVDLAEVDLVATRRELRRAQAAHEKQAISEFDYDMAQDNVAMAELKHQHAVEDAKLQSESLAFELKTARLDIEKQRLAVTELQRQVDKLTITSPVTGIIGNLLVEDRDAVSRNQPLLTIVDLTAFEVDLQIPDSYASVLTTGLVAEVSHQGRRYPAALVSISPEVVNSQVTARVRFTAEVPDNLRQNQRVSAQIELDGRNDVLMVERGPFLETGGGRIAYVVEDNLARRIKFESGIVSVSSVEVKGGLEEGQHIVISSLSEFNNAQTVYLAD